MGKSSLHTKFIYAGLFLCTRTIYIETGTKNFR